MTYEFCIYYLFKNLNMLRLFFYIFSLKILDVAYECLNDICNDIIIKNEYRTTKKRELFVKIIVLGNQAAFPKAGRHHVSFIVSDDEGTNLLLEMGPGTCSRFQEYVPLSSITAVLISHAHADHLLDLFTFAYGVYMYNYLQRGKYRPQVYLPSHGIRVVEAIAKDLNVEKYIESLSLAPVAEEFNIRKLTVKTQRTNHFIPTVAIRIEDVQGKSVTYTSDTGFTEELVDFAKNTDLLIAEATLRKDDESPQLKHLSGRLAGMLAKKSAAKRLLLAHLWYEYDESEILDEAKQVFDGEIEIAQEGKIYTI